MSDLISLEITLSMSLVKAYLKDFSQSKELLLSTLE
jgi:hypothetical protein